MTGILVLEQALNGLQFGLMLFLLAAGLTLVFGIMDMINLAHGSLYMVGAYLVAAAAAASGSFWIGLGAGITGAAVFGVLLELTVLRRLYTRDHLSQVLGTFAILWRLDRSWFGRACRAVRDNSEAAAAMGVNVPWIKIAAFTLTSTLAGAAGIVYAFVDNGVAPTSFV